MSKNKRPDVTLTRAREKKAEQDERARRVASIVDEMSQATWDTRTSQRLAAEWGCSVDAMRSYAREASSIIRLAFSPEQREDLRARVLLASERCFREALSRRRFLPDGSDVPDPDVKGAIAAQRLLADVHGLIVQKVDGRVTVGRERAEFEAAAPLDQARMLREMCAELAARAEELEAAHGVPQRQLPSNRR